MRTIVIDPLNIESVARAIDELKSFQEWLKERVNELCERLAKEYALKTVAEDYGYTEGGSIVCTAEEIENGWLVKAEGKGVFFVEYGTGIIAGTGPILGTPPVSTEPGSWSATHAGTYQEWFQGGRNWGEPYRYEHAPRSGMYFAFQAASENVLKVAEEVFGS